MNASMNMHRLQQKDWHFTSLDGNGHALLIGRDKIKKKKEAINTVLGDRMQSLDKKRQTLIHVTCANQHIKRLKI